MLYNGMEMNLFSKALAGEEKWNGKLSEKAPVLQLRVSLRALPKLIIMQQSCPLKFFLFSVLMAKPDLSCKCM